ncbi:Uncharacterised protein [Shigella sonnei]|nr:Uncharacterised protein [Shigella sonnei]CSQ74315.1 Uncharacterised protein [Shigella sonnei]
MAAHIVRADAEKNAGLNIMLTQDFQQTWHAFTGATKGIDINA